MSVAYPGVRSVTSIAGVLIQTFDAITAVRREHDGELLGTVHGTEDRGFWIILFHPVGQYIRETFDSTEDAIVAILAVQRSPAA